MPDDLLSRLQHFHTDAFPAYQSTFQTLVDEGRHPTDGSRFEGEPARGAMME
jgi:hypothetical protein